MNDNLEERKQEPNSLQKQLTTVTPLSKYLAMILFVILPFGGFWLGVNEGQEWSAVSSEVPSYQAHDTQVSSQESEIDPYPSFYNKNYFSWSSSSISSNDNTVEFLVPESWISTGSYSENDARVSINLESESDVFAHNGPDISIHILEKDSAQEFESFVSSHQDGWYFNYEVVEIGVLNGGYRAIFTDDSADPIAQRPTKALFVELGATDILIITFDQNEQGDISWEEFLVDTRIDGVAIGNTDSDNIFVNSEF